MNENYWHRTPSGRVVRIGKSSRDSSRWAVWLDGVLVSDVFVSAEEAAACANRGDFHDRNKECDGRISNTNESINIRFR